MNSLKKAGEWLKARLDVKFNGTFTTLDMEKHKLALLAIINSAQYLGHLASN